MDEVRGESVLFALLQDGKVLCEAREWDGRLMKSVPGGKIETWDQQPHEDAWEAALRRELQEELGIVPTQFMYIGDIYYAAAFWMFHVFVVMSWAGDIPEFSFEEHRPLYWVHLEDLVDNSHMPGLSTLLQTELETIQ